MSQTLAEILHRQKIESLVRQAETIRCTRRATIAHAKHAS